MPKRFTVTEKWNDEWFINLSPQAKVIWEYLRDTCDICGVWEVNIELLRFRVKFSPQVDVWKHLNELNEVAESLGMEPRIEWFEDRKRGWLRNFIKVQYGVLSDKSSTHRGVIKVINNHTLNKGLPKGFETLIGTLKVKNKVKNKYTTVFNNTNTSRELNIPFDTFWDLYDKKRDRVPCEKKWKALTDEERQAAIDFIPKYKISQPIKQYRKDPQTFLNNKNWNDELIDNKNGSHFHEPLPTGRKLVKL